MTEKYCDNRSVGVIVTNDNDEFALLKRGRFPIGIAPPAGHVDDHGSPEQAAIDEVDEEIGIRLAVDSLQRTAIHERRVNNICRRLGGNYHVWTVYRAEINGGELMPDPDETQGAAWYTQEQTQALARRTRLYQMGRISESAWAQDPGLEPVWLDYFTELGYIEL